jgi:hypothetical protein
MSKEIITKTAPETAVYTGPTGLASNITGADLRLPRIALLQALSPLVQADSENFKQGMFINTLTQEAMPAPVVLTPTFIFKNVIKFKPRTEGGGILYKTMNFTKEVLKDISWNGDQKPAATQNINAVCLVKGIDMPLITVFHDTSFKTGQDLLTLCTLSGYAWKYQYELQSVKTTNTKGTFYVMRVRRLGETPNVEAAMAADLYENVKGMAIDTDYEGTTVEGTTGAEPQEF